MDTPWKRHLPPQRRFVPVWERSLTPQAQARAVGARPLGSAFAMIQPPPLQREPKPESPLPSKGFLGQVHDDAAAKRRKIRWPKECPNIKEEKKREVAKWQVILDMVSTDHSGLAKQLAATD